jgi:pimeloyl-[acyl-carrier protein] methyl ester esterase
MHFVLVHGWGFNAGIWRELVRQIGGNAGAKQLNLGFIRGGPEDAGDWPQDAVAIGHSLGLLWLLRHKNQRRFKGLVSIQGFDRFSPPIPRRRLASMRRELAGDPAATLASFWRGCGTEPFAAPSTFDLPRLDEGLCWLMDWDETATKASLDCPILALAARDDAIVPPSMSAAIWGEENVIWSERGGHVLPLARPEWCAQHVLDFAHDLET